MLKKKHEIENYEEKSKTLRENGWETWYHDDNWIKREWIKQGKPYDYMGSRTNDAYEDVCRELRIKNLHFTVKYKK
jgi:hypothetical protein